MMTVKTTVDVTAQSIVILQDLYKRHANFLHVFLFTEYLIINFQWREGKGRSDNKTTNRWGKSENSLILSPKLEMLPVSEGKLSMDPVSETVSEMVGRHSSAPFSLSPWVNWRNTYKDKKKTFTSVHVQDNNNIISLFFLRCVCSVNLCLVFFVCGSVWTYLL